MRNSTYVAKHSSLLSDTVIEDLNTTLHVDDSQCSARASQSGENHVYGDDGDYSGGSCYNSGEENENVSLLESSVSVKADDTNDSITQLNQVISAESEVQNSLNKKSSSSYESDIPQFLPSDITSLKKRC